MSGNLTSCNSLQVANALTVGSNATIGGNVVASNVTCSGAISAGSVTANSINGLSSQNLSSLDTTTSVTYQLQNNYNNMKTYTDQQIALLYNNTDVCLNSVVELANALQGNPNFGAQVMNSLGDKVSLTANGQNISGNNLRLTGLNPSFSNQFTTPDVLLLDTSGNSTSVKNNLSSLNSRVAVDTSGNVKITTGNANTSLQLGVNNGSQFRMLSNGAVQQVCALNANDIALNYFESNSGRAIYIVPKAGAGGFNNIVPNNASVVVAAGGGNPSLALTVGSSYTSGLLINERNLLIGSGNNQSSGIPTNYIYFDGNSVNVNTQTSNSSYALNVNGHMSCGTSNVYANEIVLGGSFLVRDNINNSNSLISTLNSQMTTANNNISALQGLAVKACGCWDVTSGTGTWTLGSVFIQTTNGYTTAGGVSNGLSFTLKSSVTGIVGVVMATPLGDGYTCTARYLGNNTIIVGSIGGGSNPVTSARSFYWLVI